MSETPCIKTSFKSVEEAFTACRDAIIRLQHDLETSISALPDNPAITRISALSFTMPSAAINASLSMDPFTYCYRSQYDRLLEHFTAALKNPSAAMVDKIQKIFAESAKGGGRETIPGRTYVYHPEAIKQIAPLAAIFLQELKTYRSIRAQLF